MIAPLFIPTGDHGEKYDIITPPRFFSLNFPSRVPESSSQDLSYNTSIEAIGAREQEIILSAISLSLSNRPHSTHDPTWSIGPAPFSMFEAKFETLPVIVDGKWTHIWNPRRISHILCLFVNTLRCLRSNVELEKSIFLPQSVID